MPQNIAHYREHAGSKPDKFYKTTLFQGDHLLIGLNCLEPGQVQPVHEHADQDKFYYVIEGTGEFTVGEQLTSVGAGHVVWAEAGVPHGVENKGPARLIVLVGIAPPPQ
ncbi:MAG: cupin domain-containing protein [Chloroflexota bacterium]